MARDYELGIVINPDVGDDQARAIVERITQVVGSNDGQVVRVNAVGRRRLAYPIERHRDGLYFFFDLMLEPTSLEEIERTLRVNEDIIRHLLLKRDPRVVTQQRQRDAEADALAAENAARAEAQQAARAAAEAAGETGEAEQPDQNGEPAVAVPDVPDVPVAVDSAESGAQDEQAAPTETTEAATAAGVAGEAEA
ncbi:MAG: 30S ribosomal protein S6 [Ktedonobacterales bacterium]